jgi:hypothetical protein
MMLKAEPQLLENIGKVVKVLELLSDKEFKDRQDVNEILSLKYHILHYILKVSWLDLLDKNVGKILKVLFWRCSLTRSSSIGRMSMRY